MLSKMSLRSLMLLILIIVVIVPMVLIAVFAIPSFSRQLRAEAMKAIDLHQAVGRERMAQASAMHTTQMSSFVANTTVDTARADADALISQLKVQSELLDFDFMFWVDPEGRVRGSNTGVVSHQLDWPLLSKLVDSTETTTFVAIVPPTELSALGEDGRLAIEAKPAEGGALKPGELAGALALVSVAPVSTPSGRPAGVVVGVNSFKRDYKFVDSISAAVGGEATVFQNGARVSTTVRNAEGQRAIGTPVSDLVRAKALAASQAYRGEAMVVGKKHITAYDPLKDPEGKTVGLLFVGIPDKPYSDAVARFALNFVLVLLGGLILAVALGWGAAGTVAHPIVEVGKAAEKVAGGDLTISVPQEGYREAIQLGGAFNSMTAALRDILRNVGSSATKLDTVSGEIAGSSRGGADSAAAQASAVAEASATIEEITRSFGAVADGAHRVLEIAEDSLEVAENGRGTIEGSAAAIDRLAGGTMQVHEAAERLSEVAEDIDQITSVIGSIAEQTKILALNAAIEAARAGEAGKGFGVVSTEIRSLADSVSESAGRIGTLVTGIQSASKSLTATAAEQGQLATDTVIAGGRTRASFDDILEQMARTAAAAREIAAAATQQQAAARQIVDVMQQVSAGVSESASSSNQLAESAGDVKREAAQLNEGLRKFRT